MSNTDVIIILLTWIIGFFIGQIIGRLPEWIEDIFSKRKKK